MYSIAARAFLTDSVEVSVLCTGHDLLRFWSLDQMRVSVFHIFCVDSGCN